MESRNVVKKLVWRSDKISMTKSSFMFFGIIFIQLILIGVR